MATLSAKARKQIELLQKTGTTGSGSGSSSLPPQRTTTTTTTRPSQSTTSSSFYGTTAPSTPHRTRSTALVSRSTSGDMGFRKRTGKAVTAAKAGAGRGRARVQSLPTPTPSPSKTGRPRRTLSRSTLADSDDEGAAEEVERMILPRARTRSRPPSPPSTATKKAKSYPTPRSTPTKTKRPTMVTPTKSRAKGKEVVEQQEEEEEVADYIPNIDTSVSSSDSEDELDLLSLPLPTPIPIRTLRTPTKKRPSSPASDDEITPSKRRSSARHAKLPIERDVLDNTPTSLRSALVGYHMDVSSDEESDEDEDEQAEETAVESREVVRCAAKARSLYSVDVVQGLLDQVGAKLIRGEEKVEEGEYLKGYEEWEKNVRYGMRNVVEKGVGNCLILLGQRGVGKGLIVNRSLELLREKHDDAFIVVRINGLVETTDRMALRSIARQLREGGLGGVFDEEESGTWNSSANTMSTLLKLLEPSTTASPRKARQSKTPPIIFILHSFDLFALHPRQSLLYSLLDMIQGNRRKNGMGLIGLSSRTDCLGLLEKRVRSRCQSQVLMMVRSEAGGRNQMERMKVVVEKGKEEWGEEERCRVEWNEEVEAFEKDSKVVQYFERINKIYGTNPAKIREVLSHMYYRLESSTINDKDEEMVSLPKLSLDLLPPTPVARSQSDLLTHLSVLELTVCIAAMNTLFTGASNSFTTEMLWSTYGGFAKRPKGGPPGLRMFSKEEFCMAIDSLRAQELFLPTSGRANTYLAPSYSNGYKSFRFVIWEWDSLKKVVNERSDAHEDLRRWCKRLDIKMGQ